MMVNKTTILIALSLIAFESSYATDITINEQKEYQTIIGFGGNDPGNEVNRLVNDLGLSAHRAYLGSDGSSGPNWAKLLELKNAGVKTFFATPWSPPAEYKYTNMESGGDPLWNRLSNGLGPKNDYLHPNADPEKGGMRNFYPDMAVHLTNYIKTFKTQVGIDLFAITPQNEPAFDEPYASCIYNPWQYRDITYELGKKMAADGLLGKTIIDVGEDMLSTGGAMVARALGDTATSKYVGAVSFHGYSNGITPQANNTAIYSWKNMATFAEGSNPAKKPLIIMQTEISGYMNWTGGIGGDGDPCPGAQGLGTAMFIALKYGHIHAWFWWRLATTSEGWIDESLILNGTPLKTYYVSKQFYKFIRPGAVMINAMDTLDKEVGCIAFNHKTNKNLTLVFVNSSTSQKNITIKGTSLPTTYEKYVTSESKDCVKETNVGTTFTLDAGSVTTLVGANYNPPLVAVSRPTHFVKVNFHDYSKYSSAELFDASGKLLKTISGYELQLMIEKKSTLKISGISFVKLISPNGSSLMSKCVIR